MNLRNSAVAAALVLVAALAAPLQAAETVALYLKANGVDVKGDSTKTSLGRQDSIECLYYEQSIGGEPGEAVRNPGVSEGRAMAPKVEPHYNPIVIRKRIDKASPILVKAISDNQIVEGTFKFFRPSATGDGTTQQFYTVKFEGGHVDSIKQYVPDTMDPKTANDPPMEEVTFSYSSITFTYVNGAVQR